MRRAGRVRAGILWLVLAANAGLVSPASAGWAAEARLGGAWNLPLPLSVRQAGEPTLKLTGRWATQPFRFPLYYAARLVQWKDRGGWALDLTHHKIYLQNPPPAITAFAVSHGYNLITVQRLLEGRTVFTGFGAGLILAHPENEVRGLRLDENEGILGSGYYFGGPTMSALAGTVPPERQGVYASAELRLTVSWARLPVAQGSATVPNAALHATLGVGWKGGR